MTVRAISPDVLAWLLAPDDPGPRYLALRNLIHLTFDDRELRSAAAAAHTQGPIASILAAMTGEGYWSKPGPGYTPKYFSTVWAMIALAQLGATARVDERIGRACAYVLDHALTPTSQFTASTAGAPSGTADCLQGNLCAALLDLGCDDLRLDSALDWMARTVTGEGIAPKEDRHAPRRYYAGKCGPLFRCGANDGQSCAWGAVKVMLALGKIPPARRTPVIDEAIRQGVEFLFSVEPATALWPSPYADKPSGNWWKFGFPVFYVADLLQVAEALGALGYGVDPRLARTLDLIGAKADGNGRWPLEYSYAGKLWDGVDFGPKKKPNKWVTIRALSIAERLNVAGGSYPI